MIVVNEKKSSGATFTPSDFSDFLAKKIVNVSEEILNQESIKILDPAIGEGELVCSLLSAIDESIHKKIEVYGFDTNSKYVDLSFEKIQKAFPSLKKVDIRNDDFLEFSCLNKRGQLHYESFDLIIANPPYVRTQILGSNSSQGLTKKFNLNGRVDLYQAFIIGMIECLSSRGTMGIIVSNRFLTTKTGACIREAFIERCRIHNVWDLGDTKLFDAAVLPAVILAKGLDTPEVIPLFYSIYETKEPARAEADTPLNALEKEGPVQVGQRAFMVNHGRLYLSSDKSQVWRRTDDSVEDWLARVESKTWARFVDIGKIRVGVKTCADKVFISKSWPKGEQIELLKPLTTHFIARRFKADSCKENYQILYTHLSKNGKRQVVDLNSYPRAREYLEKHKDVLEKRTYLAQAGRKWYEIWVPQDPKLWDLPKLVFRDIAEEPTFWIDFSGSVVNGDCYWLAPASEDKSEYLWLAVAVANSAFIEKFYDIKFNNKLYAGRRRFITQYVEQFPIPDPMLDKSKRLIELAKDAFDAVGSNKYNDIKSQIDELVWESFSVS